MAMEPGFVETASASVHRLEADRDGFVRWWDERLRAGRFVVEQIPFGQLKDWGFDPATGNLAHDSGRFFSVEGLQVCVAGQVTRSQPIINQPEIGILGILVKQIDGEMYCLMQAKMEPGNVNSVQLSPTVQATRSNFTQVHRGSSTRHLEHFVGQTRGQVLVDVLQSEQGAWFWRKRNRNMVVMATGPVLEHPDYRWMRLREVRALLAVDNLVNMDARTVLSCMPFELGDELGEGGFGRALARSYEHQASDTSPGPVHSVGSILSWFTETKAGCDWNPRLVPLDAVSGWRRTPEEICDEDSSQFRIMSVRVEAGSREVQRWTQPLLAPRGQGLATFLVRRIEGVLHLLVQAHAEPGLLDLVEMAPTIQVHPGVEADQLDPFARELLDCAGEVLFDTVLSEEGGRFHHALTRYRIVEVEPDSLGEVPPSYRWMTMAQLMDLLRHGHYLNIEARSLLACVHTLQ